MTDHLSALYSYICELTPSQWDDPDYQRANQEYAQVEAEVKEKIGSELLRRYQRAEAVISYQDHAAVFAQALRVGAQVMLELLANPTRPDRPPRTARTAPAPR